MSKNSDIVITRETNVAKRQTDKTKTHKDKDKEVRIV